MNTNSLITRTASPRTLLFILILSSAAQTFAQSSPADTPPKPKATPTPYAEKEFFRNILRDQRAIWTSPFHLNQGDMKWVAPLGLTTAALLATDRHTSGALVENGENRTRLRISNDLSRLGTIYATGGVAAVFYLAGRAKNNGRARETGLLSAEALIDSSIVVEAVKTISQRQRPPVDHTSGEFFDGGSSFPSGHAISAWSLATVIAQEYGHHRPLVSFGAYGLATVVSVSRYTGRNHFLSDALIGSAMGYGIGRYVYHKHHDPALDSAPDSAPDSSNEKQTSRMVTSRLFPRIAPLYYPRAHVYGAMLAWHF